MTTDSLYRGTLVLALGCAITLLGCSDDTAATSDSETSSETGEGEGEASASEASASQTGDGDGDSGDGDGDTGSGDGDGDGDSASGDGDGDTGSGDGDGDTGSGDGDGDTGSGDGDGDTGSGDGDGDTGSGDGDGDTGDGDGDTGGGPCSEGCGQPNCGPCPPPPEPPVMVAGFAIDATEVSNGQYEAFLAVEFEQDFFDALPAGCEFKTDFTPDEFPNDPNPNLPVVNVDWCDAYAYCEWAGQELCGAIGGGANDFGDSIDWTTSQWYRACTMAGVFEYPYGVLYEGDTCNTVDAGFGGVAEVGAFSDCEGGLPGLFDMSGNVWEWENSCNDMGECRRRGGSYFSDASNSRCGVGSVREREFRNPNLGFRCCETL